MSYDPISDFVLLGNENAKDDAMKHDNETNEIIQQHPT